MEQILLVLTITLKGSGGNESRTDKRRISYRMEQIGLHGTKIHLVFHIWVESGSAKFEVLEVSLLVY